MRRCVLKRKANRGSCLMGTAVAGGSAFRDFRKILRDECD
jgi:hypothetical protein